MRLSHVSTQNFRTFDNLDVDLQSLNVLIGANASGKSNFLDLIDFIGDIAEYGLEDAIYLQGGIKEIKNRHIGDSKNFKLNFKVDDFEHPAFIPSVFEYKSDYLIEFRIKSFELNLELELEEGDYKVIDEDIEVLWDVVKSKRDEDEAEEQVVDGKSGIRMYTEEGDYKYTIDYPDLDMGEEEIKEKAFPGVLLKSIEDQKLGKKELLVENEQIIIFRPVLDQISSITVYDIDPNTVKTGSQVTGTKELEPDGSNLAIVLEDIGKDKQSRENFNSYAKRLLPFADDYSVKRNEDRSFHLKIKEKIFPSDNREENYASPSMISDGTVNIYSLIVALNFEEDKPIIGIEEPEKNIHPSLLSKIVRVMEESSENKQIIATTHEATLLKEIDLSNVFMIKRNEDGFSELEKPKDNDMVSSFLEQDIGVDELMRDNILG